MQYARHDFDKLAREHHALMRDYGRVQARCSEQMHAQAQEIERLEAQAIRMRAEVILRDTALAWEREERASLEASIPGLPKRIALARRVETLLARIQVLMRERLQWERPRSAVQDDVDMPVPQPRHHMQSQVAAALEASLRAADLVICQTGCLSHGDYWRVQDYCKRTSKTCVLVGEGEALDMMQARRAEPAGLRAPSLAGSSPEASA